MNRKRRAGRRSARFPLRLEGLEQRRLLSGGRGYSLLEVQPAAYPAIHPNRPVMPFATPSKKASFLDPSVAIRNGQSVVVSYQSYIAPYVTLDASGGGAIKLGDGSEILDAATIVANPHHRDHLPQVLIGNQVSIGYGATILGPSTLGAYQGAAQPTSIGARAVIDGATIEPGAIVSPLARVGPGVTVPSGYRVLPGMNVTTNAEASNPKLGKVVPVTSTDTRTVSQALALGQSAAAGYTGLYQGNSATGTSPGADPAVSGVNNGNLATVEGVSAEPLSSLSSTNPKKTIPYFVSPHRGLVGGLLYNFPGRIIGFAEFNQRAWQVAHHLGRANSIRADQGQPIQIGSIAHTGDFVVITAPLGGTLTLGQNLRAGSHAVILGGPSVKTQLGDDVTIGSGAVLDRTSLGSGSTVGSDAYLLDSTFPAHTVIPARAIYVNNRFQGVVQP
jgi:carbonic anhydrase/acetyltransferase-like protein (isoleucine patch superfamily)